MGGLGDGPAALTPPVAVAAPVTPTKAKRADRPRTATKQKRERQAQQGS